MFALQWEYLTDKVVASNWDERSTAEWPPHPDRVFQALVAAWGESGSDATLRNALHWIERLGAPHLCMPVATPCSDRPVFVPTNDIEASARTKTYSDKMNELLPHRRGKAQRHFPAHTVDGACSLVWPNAEPPPGIREALETLCARVTHIGHSSSLVRIWVTDSAPEPTHIPSDSVSDTRLRLPYPGRLDALIEAYAEGGLSWRRPAAARWQGYITANTDGKTPAMSVFGDDWAVLRRVAGTAFNLEQAPAFAEALRGTLMKAANGLPAALSLLSGHAADGTSSEVAHVAFVPLGFAGHEYADGHLLGIAVVLPRDASYEDRDACLRALVNAGDAETGAVTLTFGTAGTCTLLMEDREQPPDALRPATWCRTSARWASVTPIALDRMPPRRCADPDRWAEEQVALACQRIGLPCPASVRTMPVSRFTGAPTCRAFAPLKRRSDGGPRWHVHADIEFAEAVHGPLLLGAGRFRSYGICRPYNPREENA